MRAEKVSFINLSWGPSAVNIWMTNQPPLDHQLYLGHKVKPRAFHGMNTYEEFHKDLESTKNPLSFKGRPTPNSITNSIKSRRWPSKFWSDLLHPWRAGYNKSLRVWNTSAQKLCKEMASHPPFWILHCILLLGERRKPLRNMIFLLSVSSLT